jgi:hypothetical protein
MSFRLIERAELDVQKWDELVESTKDASLFSHSFYLDAVAENWCVLVDDKYSSGIALPYSVRAQRKILYTPIFVSYLEILGPAHFRDFEGTIRRSFKTIEIEFKQKVLGEPTDVFVTQFLNPEKKRKGQVNRMLNKSKRAGYEIRETNDWTSVFDMLNAQLKGKFSGMTEISLNRLKQAYTKANELGLLRTFEIVEGDQSLGGVICIEKNGCLLYSKGACPTEVRDQGGMYAAIDAAIYYANERELPFDFGGSRVEGVRRFNHAFGGEDLEYYSYRIDRSPFWFRWVRRMKKRWGKKS